MGSDDPAQDKQYGEAAADDQDLVDELDHRGLPTDASPSEPSRQPRTVGTSSPTGKCTSRSS